MPNSTCNCCNTTFNHGYSSTGRFCSTDCSNEYRKNTVTKAKVELGKVRDRGTLKGYLSREHGYACVECNRSTWRGKPLSLHVDHIDGNSDNNFPNNLRLLCPNCHSQTDTFSGRNKKNTKRSQYMAEYRARKKLDIV